VVFIVEKFAHITLPLQGPSFFAFFASISLVLHSFYLRLGVCLESLLEAGTSHLSSFNVDGILTSTQKAVPPKRQHSVFSIEKKLFKVCSSSIQVMSLSKRKHRRTDPLSMFDNEQVERNEESRRQLKTKNNKLSLCSELESLRIAYEEIRHGAGLVSR
jgi:hypothetical protein